MRSLVIFFLSFCLVANLMALDIVKDGKAAAVIVVKPPIPVANKKRVRGFPANDRSAAKVLATWIKKISGAELPIVNTAPKGKTPIYIGRAAVEHGLDLSGIKSPSKEGLRILCDGHKLLIGGQNGTATVKAVCRFLEELGCRFFMDHQLGEVYPSLKTITVSNSLDIKDRPGLLMRRIWGSEWSMPTLWKIWNGAGGVKMETRHAWSSYVPNRKKLFAAHPEYFALRNGKRKCGSWICTSNPEIRKIFAEQVSKRIESGVKNPSISVSDGNGYCECEKCRAQDDPKNIEPSSGRVSISNRYADFFDYVGREVLKKHPDSMLSFYCYANYTQAPSNGIKLSPNLCAWIAPIRYSRVHCIGNPYSPSRQQLQQVIDGWAKCAKQIGYRTYNYNLAEILVPFSKLAIWKHDFPYLKKHGCIGADLETIKSWELYGPHIYQSIRLAYDPNADSDKLMDDYFEKFYGKAAAPLMKEYWMSLDNAFKNLKSEAGSYFALHLVYTDKMLRKCRSLLEKAMKAADTKARRQRVAMTLEGFKNAEQYMQMRKLMSKGDFAAAAKLYDSILARNKVEVVKRLGAKYTIRYFKRFIAPVIQAGLKATAPPNRLLQVLSDRWRLAYDPENKGEKSGFAKPGFDDSKWALVQTYGNPLDVQGFKDRKTYMWYRTSFNLPKKYDKLSLFFAEVDGKSTVFVNGQKVATDKKGRRPFSVDISKAVVKGKNTVAVKVDHRQISELFLGGIIRPVFLIQNGVTP